MREREREVKKTDGENRKWRRRKEETVGMWGNKMEFCTRKKNLLIDATQPDTSEKSWLTFSFPMSPLTKLLLPHALPPITRHQYTLRWRSWGAISKIHTHRHTKKWPRHQLLMAATHKLPHSLLHMHTNKHTHTFQSRGKRRLLDNGISHPGQEGCRVYVVQAGLETVGTRPGGQGKINHKLKDAFKSKWWEHCLFQNVSALVCLERGSQSLFLSKRYHGSYLPDLQCTFVY